MGFEDLGRKQKRRQPGRRFDRVLLFKVRARPRAGLTGWLKTLSLEVAGEGVLVNSVCSGLFDTARLRELFEARARRSGRTPEEERRLAEREIPLGRIGRPEELGAVVAFLASERASFLNGVALACDGGATRGLL